eukprot:GHVS01000306.1.p1 GENE.GHVS01000306.1~~GHVS01000306.1.p1  ORF type:complete len:469 (+),score=79.32 GHVS01000306.1:595-2001(+)
MVQTRRSSEAFHASDVSSIPIYQQQLPSSPSTRHRAVAAKTNSGVVVGTASQHTTPTTTTPYNNTVVDDTNVLLPDHENVVAAFYDGRRKSSFLRRATTTALEKSIDLTRHYAALWVGLIITILVVRQFFSDGGFSSSLTLSSAFQCFGYLLVVVKVLTEYASTSSVGSGGSLGISAGSLWLALLTLVTRLYPNICFYGYLPVDRSGDWLYQCVDICSLVLVSILLVAMASNGSGPTGVRHRKSSSGMTSGDGTTGRSTSANTGGSRMASAGHRGGGRGGSSARGSDSSDTSSSGVISGIIIFIRKIINFIFTNWLEFSLVTISFTFSIFVHASRNRHLPSDISWAFSVYLESFIMLPQLLLMTKQASYGHSGSGGSDGHGGGSSGDVDKLTAHYLASISAANIACLLFWWKTSRHLVPKTSNSRVGWAVFLAVVFRNLVMVDYVYHYVRAMVTGQRLTLRRWSSCNV